MSCNYEVFTPSSQSSPLQSFSFSFFLSFFFFFSLFQFLNLSIFHYIHHHHHHHITIITMANLGANNLMQHPLAATASAIGAAGADPRPNKMSLFMSANEGPAEIAAKITGAKVGGKREDDSAFFTNNEAIPWPDPLTIPCILTCGRSTKASAELIARLLVASRS